MIPLFSFSSFHLSSSSLLLTSLSLLPLLHSSFHQWRTPLTISLRKSPSRASTMTVNCLATFFKMSCSAKLAANSWRKLNALEFSLRFLFPFLILASRFSFFPYSFVFVVLFRSYVLLNGFLLFFFWVCLTEIGVGEMKGSIHVMLDVRCFFGFLLGPGTGNLDHA